MSRRRPPPLLAKSALLAAIHQPAPPQRRYPLAIIDAYYCKVPQDDDAAAQDLLRDSLSFLDQRISTERKRETFEGFVSVADDSLSLSGHAKEADETVAVARLKDALSTSSLPPKPNSDAEALASRGLATVQIIDLSETSAVLSSPPSDPPVRGYTHPSSSPLPTSELLLKTLQSLPSGDDQVFELQVDCTRNGAKALGRAVDLISKVRHGQESGKQTKFAIGHLGNPDAKSVLTSSRSAFLNEWEIHINELALMPFVYLKLSNYLSWLPKDLVSQAFAEHLERPYTGDKTVVDGRKECKRLLKIFLFPVLEAVGEDRIMWGSCISAYGIAQLEIAKSEQHRLWEFAYKLALDTCLEIGLHSESLVKIFAENARLCYQIAPSYDK